MHNPEFAPKADRLVAALRGALAAAADITLPAPADPLIRQLRDSLRRLPAATHPRLRRLVEQANVPRTGLERARRVALEPGGLRQALGLKPGPAGGHNGHGNGQTWEDEKRYVTLKIERMKCIDRQDWGDPNRRDEVYLNYVLVHVGGTGDPRRGTANLGLFGKGEVKFKTGIGPADKVVDSERISDTSRWPTWVTAYLMLIEKDLSDEIAAALQAVWKAIKHELLALIDDYIEAAGDGQTPTVAMETLRDLVEVVLDILFGTIVDLFAADPMGAAIVSSELLHSPGDNFSHGNRTALRTCYFSGSHAEYEGGFYFERNETFQQG